jgi:hypothetical protein
VTLELGLAAAMAGLLVLFWLTPLGVPTLKQLGQGRPQLDLKFGFGADEAYELIALYGARGVAHWRRMLWLDMIFPGIYAALFALLLRNWADWVHAGPAWRAAALCCPVLAGASDYVENILLLRVLSALPQRKPASIAAASAFTRSKLIFSVLTLTLPLSFWVWSFATGAFHGAGR